MSHSLRGERIDERFTDDNEFWRYTGKIGNPYGDPLYEVQIQKQTQIQMQKKEYKYMSRFNVNIFFYMFSTN